MGHTRSSASRGQVTGVAARVVLAALLVPVISACRPAPAGDAVPTGQAQPTGQPASGSPAPAGRPAPPSQPPPPAQAPTEREWLAQRFGPDRKSQYLEEWILRDFFGERRDGVFLDVGASEHEKFSNTWYLEKVLGWSGIAVEPQASLAEGWKVHRPKSVFIPAFASDRSDATATLYVGRVSVVASATKSFTDRWGGNAGVETPTVTLNDVLKGQKIGRVHFVSIDVELHEPEVLAGFDLRRYAPELVCIEAHPEVRQAILDYFTTRNYVVIGKYLRVDDQNLYFMPRGRALPNWPDEVMKRWTH